MDLENSSPSISPRIERKKPAPVCTCLAAGLITVTVLYHWIPGFEKSRIKDSYEFLLPNGMFTILSMLTLGLGIAALHRNEPCRSIGALAILSGILIVPLPMLLMWAELFGFGLQAWLDRS